MGLIVSWLDKETLVSLCLFWLFGGFFSALSLLPGWWEEKNGCNCSQEFSFEWSSPGQD